MIFKVIIGSSSHAFWWERTVLHSMETLFDAGLVALESISPGKDIYYGTLWCRTLPSKENYPRQRPDPWFLRQILLSPVQCRIIFPTKGRDQNFWLSLWIWLHLIKIPSHVKASIKVHTLKKIAAVHSTAKHMKKLEDIWSFSHIKRCHHTIETSKNIDIFECDILLEL